MYATDTIELRILISVITSPFCKEGMLRNIIFKVNIIKNYIQLKSLHSDTALGLANFSPIPIHLNIQMFDVTCDCMNALI